MGSACAKEKESPLEVKDMLFKVSGLREYLQDQRPFSSFVSEIPAEISSKKKLPHLSLPEIKVPDYFYSDFTLPIALYSDNSYYRGHLDGKSRENFGEQVCKDGSFYIGGWKANYPHGEGLVVLADGSFYQGNFENGFIKGKGRGYDKNSEILYDGEWDKGLPNGDGKAIWDNFQEYRGSWHNGMKSGSGVWKNLKSGDRYEGEFFEDKFHGEGTYFEKSGVIKSGLFQNDEYVQKGLV